jgi:hypothetical protein
MAALISRVFYARLIFGMGRAPLTLASMLASAGAFLLLALSLSLPAMYAILIALGFGMGIASTLTISGVVHLAPPQAYGTALTLRMTGNRVGQIVFPAVAGLLAAATGVAGILVAIGLGLAVSGIAVAVRQPPALLSRIFSYLRESSRQIRPPLKSGEPFLHPAPPGASADPTGHWRQRPVPVPCCSVEDMVMRNSNPESDDFDLNDLLHPARAFEHPMNVVNDPDLTLSEKRAILASWASDACAVEAGPALRYAPGAGKTVEFDDVMDALRTLDRVGERA